MNPRDSYTIIEKIGKGAIGTIYKCARKSDGQLCALKHTGVSKAERQSVINECSLIKALSSEHIVTCGDVFDFDKKIWVFLELMDGGDLSNVVLKSANVYSEAFCKYTLYMVAMGLRTMHVNNVLHRDIKSENILCKPNGDIKIADLGLSVFLNEQ